MLNREKSGIRLIFVLTRGASLAGWQRAGIIERELALYRLLAAGGVKITILTYGGKEEHNLAFPGVGVLSNHLQLPATLFSILAPLIYFKEFSQANLIMTNQVDGWWTAWLGKLLFRMPMILRCGFLLSLNYQRKHGKNIVAHLLKISERTGFRSSNLVVIPTEEIKKHVQEHYKVPDARITIIPNYVDTELFIPANQNRDVKKKKICFVGALKTAKNPLDLIYAINKIADPDIEIVMIGDGPLRSEVESAAKSNRICVHFLGIVPNKAIPEIMNDCSIFVLPSLWEGHPKSLLEAMGCGMAVLGYNSPGIRQVIVHGKNGLLCEPDVDSLSKSIRYLLSDANLREKLGKNAREFIQVGFSLKQIAAEYLSVFNHFILS